MSTRKKGLIWLAGVILIGTISACHHNPDVPSTPVISFQNDVLPILGGNCTAAGCHGQDGESFSLTSYNDVMSNGLVTPGDIYNSRLFTACTSRFGNIMPPPPQSPLSDHQLSVIEVWILQGAKNN